ncbi:ATPase [Clostridium botulinum]|nr:ATPase [Clostridium botulinum]NFA40379.1 ATPase [Clostridium botulinum]NFA72484.1 ATPase [Clostridium botulinum]NFB50680.1 ATPase [Clostridium botulinum]NFD16220.1 ATPase [Clostridium botulinum]
MDVIKLLAYLEELIESGSSIPLTGKVTINKKESLEVIDKIINCLPDEFKKAQWICEEKERILTEAMEEAEHIKKENIIIFKKQIENHSITREANIKAETIIKNAEKESKYIRVGARDYADELLTDLDREIEEKSQQMISILRKNLEAFAASLEESVEIKADTIRENIKELRNIK